MKVKLYRTRAGDKSRNIEVDVDGEIVNVLVDNDDVNPKTSAMVAEVIVAALGEYWRKHGTW